MSKTALITGITGMDGSHTADLLLSKGYNVYGMERYKSSGRYTVNINHILDRIEIVRGDLADFGSLYSVLEHTQPDEIYNFASQSFVGDSWNIPEHTINITGLGVVRLLEAIRNFNSNIKVVQASSSEMFGKVENLYCCPKPANPYAAAKLLAHNSIEIYRQAYGIFACAAIFFNHESERRSHQFVTRKITDGVARIKLGLTNTLILGNLEARRDWGYAPDYVEGAWRLLQCQDPIDCMFATGKTHSVKDFVASAFEAAGIVDNWESYIKHDPKLMRPVDTSCLPGNFEAAQSILGWKPTTSFEQLVAIMVDNDMRLLREVKKEYYTGRKING